MPKQQEPETLAVWMARRNLRTSQLARRAGLSSEVIRKVMRGEHVSGDTAVKICQALDVELHLVSDLHYQ